jgi:3-oxoacyl-[acyl-carrier protein] reductase
VPLWIVSKAKNGMDLQLKDKRALVTGSSSGIGRAIALALAAEGATVVVHGRHAERVEQTAALIRETGGNALVAVGDLTLHPDVKHIVDIAIGALGGIDILVNNAGAFPPTPVLEGRVTDWTALYDQNVGSMVRMTSLLAPGMIAQHWGRVIAVGSIAASSPFASFGAYGATKAASVNFAMSLAKELANTGVTSNAISPGDILTPAGEERWRAVAQEQGWGEDWEEIEKRAASERSPTLVGRFGRPSEVGELVAFIASPRAGYINGSNIRIDGGFLSSMG